MGEIGPLRLCVQGARVFVPRGGVWHLPTEFCNLYLHLYLYLQCLVGGTRSGM
jgi:hypothetical protein